MLQVVLVLTALDAVTKWWVESDFIRGQSKAIVPGFLNFTLVYNRGAAFGQGRQLPMVFFIVVSAIALGVVGYLYRRLKPEEGCSRWGLALIFSGAVGNLIDRIRLGYVIDFVDLYVGRYHWPAFNVADACITVGAVLFALDLIRRPKGA